MDEDVASKIQLFECQLVCKGWSKPAQAILYKDISLFTKNLTEYDTEEWTRFGQFVYTIKNIAPHLGTFVKRMTIRSYFNLYKGSLHTLEYILKTCPKIEELYADESSIQVVWPYLLTQHEDRLKEIKSVLKEDTITNSTLYGFVAVKLKQSLTHLQLGIDIIVQPAHPMQWNYDYIIDHLHQFVSLKSVHFALAKFPSYHFLCRVIDKFNITVNKLSFTYYIPFMSEEQELNEETAKTIKPNYSVKEIYMGTAIFLHSISYIGIKFKGLEKIVIKQVVSFGYSEDQWFQRLTELCLLLKEYEFGFSFTDEELIMQCCIELTLAMSCDDRHLVIEYNLKDRDNDQDDVPWGIILKKDCNSSKIEVKVPKDDDDCCYHTNWLHNYFPNQIQLINIEQIKEFYRDVCDATQDLLPAENSTDSVRRYISNNSSDKRSWEILNKVFLSSTNTSNAVISLGEMILCNMPQNLEYQRSNIKRLTLKNSIIYHGIFPALSLQIPVLDNLIIDGCRILTEELYTLKIFLPSTKLQSLGLVLANTKDLWRDIYLHKPMSQIELYTLKIETGTKTYWSHRRGNKKLPQYKGKPDVSHGSQDDFLIWIKCQELKKMSIIDGVSQMQLEDCYEQLE
jgi:hypothetical protein